MGAFSAERTLQDPIYEYITADRAHRLLEQELVLVQGQGQQQHSHFYYPTDSLGARITSVGFRTETNAASSGGTGTTGGLGTSMGMGMNMNISTSMGMSMGMNMSLGVGDSAIVGADAGDTQLRSSSSVSNITGKKQHTSDADGASGHDGGSAYSKEPGQAPISLTPCHIPVLVPAPEPHDGV